MDVRFFNFLARQPSATLIERPSFCGLPKRGIALILAQAMFWQPLLAQADGIAVSGTTNTTLGQAGNGVPIVNIAAPNASGLSHNQYQQYNVGTQGVILNNAADRTQSTQLGGIILGNQNLNGRAASTILNEVTGANATQLKGYTEVAGQSAHVIVANPYGISCSGCGFINTPQVTLTTGKPVLDNGRLDHFHVDGGSVSIEGAGLNADNVDQFDIITRSAKINAELHAKKLNIVTGRNDVDAQSLNATALADDGSSKPQLAIDSSALGGMYAGAIRLVGTEAGVGVKLAGNLAASAGDIQIDANGQLVMAQVAANGAVNVKAASADVQGAVYGNSVDMQTRDALNIQQSIAARDRISLSSNGQLTNHAIVEAGVNADNSRNVTGDVALNAQNLRNNGTVIASRDLSATTSQSLDNSGGTVSAQRSVQISAGTLDNRNGTLTSQGSLTLAGGTVNNTRGTVRSQQALVVRLSGDFDNTQGLLSSEALLSVSAASLANRLGVLSSAGQLSLNSSGLIDNQGGQLVTDGALDLHAGSLDNSHAGAISGKGKVSVNTGTLDNSRHGQLTSADTLSLTATQVTNQDAGRIAAVHDVNASVTGLDQQGGELFSNGTLTLDLNHGQLNTQNALINAPGALLLTNLAGVNNQNGEISSSLGFDFNADSLDNSNGKLLSNQALIVRVAQALINVKGMIAAASLDARSGTLDNSAGTLTSRGDLTLNVDGLLNNGNDGLINAAHMLNLQAIGINNGAGTLLGATALNLDLNGADLDNSNGLITTQNPLTISHLRDLKNAGGEISSSQSFSLTGRTLDNSNGKLISNQQLTLNADSLLNQLGLISGWEGLSVSGASLDNSNGGTLSSRNGNVDVSLNGPLLNGSNGALVSQKSLSVTASSVDNQGGILSSGAGQTYTVSGLLDNGQNGLIDSGAALIINAGQLGNAAGTINAQQALSFTGTDLDNSAGSIASNAGVTLDLLGSLTNTNGKLASAGDLLISRAMQINNQGGQLASQQAMTLFTGGLDNSNAGTVAANAPLLLTASGAIQNANDGLIYSKNAGLTVQAASLANSRGTLQSQGALNLTISGDIDSQTGKIIAQGGDLNLTANNVDNRGGVLSSLQNAFTARITGVLKNGYDLNNNSQGGITQAQSLDIRALAGIDNYGGRLSAQTGDALISTGSGNFDNRNGGLYSKQKINVTGNNFDNSGSNDGQIAGQQIDLTLSGALNNQLGIIESDSTLTITATSLDNQTGKLRALGTSGVTRFQIGGLLDNRNGTLETANTDLALGIGNLLNAGGSILHVGTGNFGLSTVNVMNAGGSLVTRGGLTLNATSWTNSSVIQAGTLNVNVTDFAQTATGQLLASGVFTGTGSNWSNDGLIASDGTLSLNLGGAYGGNGRLSSAGTLGFGAGQVNLGNTGSIAGGANTTLNIAGQATNYGRMTSGGNLLLNAGGVGNYGTLGSAQALTISTGSLINDHALIFSGGAMSLRVSDFLNSYADVYSLGTLSIDRDGNGALANSIVNSSSSIQSDGNMSLAASTIQNIRALLATSNAGIYTAKIEEIQCIEGVNAGDCSGKQNHVWELVERDKLEVTAASAASNISAGGNLSLKGGDLLNQSSNIATSGNLTAVLNNLTNTGVETSDTEYTRVLRSQRASDASGWYNAAAAITDQYWYLSGNYNPTNLGGLEAAVSSFIATTETELTQFNTTRQLAASDQSYSAVIQAAGAVNISTQGSFDSSVVRAGYNYIGGGPRTNTSAPGTAFSTRVTLNQQLPPDLAQQQVNPLALPGFSLPTGQNGLFRLSGQDTSTGSAGAQNWSLGGGSVSTAQHQSQTGATAQNLARVQGVPTSAVSSQPQKYLIETNPVLTDLKQFMSSDYLLSNIGYDPDVAQKRLGDGLYEQRLVQQAVTARTGQAFIDGQTSNEDQFKYLMNNAIASKDALNLTVGVSLTSEQVAALTHDIVWMEDEVVDGQHVLVPMLYLAQADNRLAPNGALIQGSDVTLIAGKDLNNAGTLKASGNLAATAGNNLVNSAVVEAGNRLDLLAGGDLTNQAGGILAGRDVSLTATNGDVTNERTVTTHDSSGGYYTQERQFTDSAARIEAANNLTIQAGRDIRNTGGALQAGNNISLAAGRDVNITSAQVLNSDAHGINNNSKTIVQNGSTVTAGHDLTVQAGRDVTAVASQLDAKNDVSIAAKGDITLTSAADEEHSYGKTKKVTSQEDHVSQVSTALTAGGSVALSAGKDLNVVASQVNAKDEAYLYAGGDVNLLAGQDSDYSYYSKTKKGSWGKKSSKMTESDSDVAVGASIHAGEKTTVVAVNDVNLQGSKASSDNGILAVLAGHDVNVLAAGNSESSASASSKSGGFGLSTTSKMNSDSSTQTSLTGSTLSGNTTLVQAGNDLLVSASNVISTEQTTLQAGNNVLIDSGAQSFGSQHSQSTKKSGLMGTGGIGVTLGSAKNTFDQDTQSQTQKGSTIGSVLGDVNVTAGKDLTIKASDVIAGKDINLIGQNVSIVQAQNQSTVTQEQEAKTSGLTLALSGVVGDAVNSTIENAKAVKGEDDSRLMALQGVKAGLSGYQAYQAAEAINSGAEQGSFIGIALSLGAQKSSSKQTQEQNVSQGSSVTAGNNLNVIATGSGSGVGLDGDITVIGSKLQAGSDMLVSANRDINLAAAANTQTVDGSNRSGGGAIGVSLGVGSSGAGLSIFANGNSGTGKEKGNGTTWTETTLDAGDKLTLVSGRDTTLTGAQASAQQVIADVGRDLSLTSLQDSDKYDSKQTNVSGGASFTFGSMTGSASLSVSQDKIKSNFESVQEQTGLYAGNGGYQISVGDHTQLNGAVIASTAEATKNTLTTGTIGWTDLKNQADFNTQHESVSGSTSGNAGAMFTGNSGSVLLVGASHSGSDSSTTYSAISDGLLTVRNTAEQQQDVTTLSHDVKHANNALSPIFDKEKEQNRLREAQLIGDIGNQAMDIIRTQGAINAANAQKDPAAIAAAREKLIAGGNTSPSDADIAKQITNTVMQQYGTGSSYQMAAQAVTAALQGLAGGNIGQALTGAAAPYLAEQIHKLTADNANANLMAHAVLGALVAQAQGNSALAGATGASIGELVAREMYPDKKTEDLTEEERQVVSALSTLAGGLSGAIVGGSAASAVTGGSTAQNAVNNNFLNQGRPDIYADRFAGCKGEQGCELTVIKDVAKESAANVDKLKGCWDSGDTVCVAQMRAQIEIDKNAYTKLKAQDVTLGDAYQQSADFYADIVDNCAGKCGWLQAALEKTVADSVDLLVYAILGGSLTAGGSTANLSSTRPPRNAANLTKGPLEKATQMSGRFQYENGPANGTLFRADNQGNITSYATYDSEGLIIKRVDITGAAHAGVPTPHAIDYGRNTLPDGTIRVQSPSTKLPPRPIRPEEMP